ncbi:hypothetical protein BMUNKI379_24440 [Burkholderia multivorans]|nr:hypothetical protein BMUNKI379_24440 [Burkholderia multivorans]
MRAQRMSSAHLGGAARGPPAIARARTLRAHGVRMIAAICAGRPVARGAQAVHRCYCLDI